MAEIRIWIDPQLKTHGFTGAETIQAVKDGFAHYFTRNANLHFNYTSRYPQVRVRSAELYFGRGVHGRGAQYGRNIWIHSGWLGAGHSKSGVARWYRVFYTTQAIASVIAHELGHMIFGRSHSRITRCLMHSDATATDLCASERVSLIRRYGAVQIPAEQQNPNDPFDVNGDGVVTPADVLALINKLHSGIDDDAAFYDVDGDGKLTSADVQAVINHLNKSHEDADTDAVSLFSPKD